MKSKHKQRAEYSVAYRKPPKRTQFKPGESGNPRGKSKGRKNADTILHEILYRQLALQDRGRLRQVPLIEAILLKFAQAALGGDTKAAAFLLNRYAPSEPDESNRDLTQEDREILDEFSRRVIARSAREPRI
jgi:hypothetical protein